MHYFYKKQLKDLIDDLAFTQNIFVEKTEVFNVLKKVQTLDPPGIAARSLQECLSLQLARKPISIPQIMASKIINEAFDLFSKKHFIKLQEKFDIN